MELAPRWNRRQFYTVSQIVNGQETVLGTHLPSPPCNIGPRSTPNYATALAQPAVQNLPGGIKVFAGQRREGFYVDLGSIFDLGALRPVQNLHLIPLLATAGVDATKDLNVHSIAIQVPKTALTANGSNPTDPASPASVIGIWTAAYRQTALIRTLGGPINEAGPFVQVSRLGNPLFNEVIVPMSMKDKWNSLPPTSDSGFSQFVLHPELAGLLPFLYPGVFPNLAAYTKSRADLAAILLTGIPSGIVGGFQNFTGATQSDMLRLNMAIKPATTPSLLGIVGGDLAGFPNGRRVFDDVVTIEIRAVAGLTIPLVDPTFAPDAAASVVTQGITPNISDRYLSPPGFPYLGTPKDGFDTPAS